MTRKGVVLCSILAGALAWIGGSAFGQVDKYRLGTQPRDRKEEQVAAHLHHALRDVLGIGDRPLYRTQMLDDRYSDLLDSRKVEASAEALAKGLDADAIPFLKRLIQDNESTRRMRYRLALMTLAKLPEDLGAPEVFCDLIVENPETRTDPLLVVSYMNPEAAQTVLSRLAAEHDDPLFRSIDLDTISSFNRHVRDVFAELKRSGGSLTEWVDPWSLEKPAEELAAACGDNLAPFVAEIVTGGSGKIERPLALMTLAKLGSHPQAAELIYELDIEHRRMSLSVVAAI